MVLFSFNQKYISIVNILIYNLIEPVGKRKMSKNTDATSGNLIAIWSW